MLQINQTVNKSEPYHIVLNISVSFNIIHNKFTLWVGQNNMW